MIKLSPYHEVFYNEWKLNPQRSDYNIVIDNNFFGQIDTDRLAKALERLSRDYFLLHSHIEAHTDSYYWVPDIENIKINLEYFSNPLSTADLLAHVQRPFDLTTGPLWRVMLIQLAPQRFRLIMVIHHLVMDAKKADFLFETVPLYYNDLTYRSPISVEQQYQQLRALVQHTEDWLQETSHQHEQFWNTQLAGCAVTDLHFLKITPTNHYDQKVENPVGEYCFSMPTELFLKVRTASKQAGLTPYWLSQLAFALVLHRYSGQEEIALCVPMAIQAGSDFIYGSHANPSLMPYRFSHQGSVSTLITQVKNCLKAIKAEHHQYFPLQHMLSTTLDSNLMDVGFTQTSLKNRSFNFVGTFDEIANSELNIDLVSKLLFFQEIRDNQIFYRVLYQKSFIDTDLLIAFIQTYQRIFSEIVDDLLNNDTAKPISQYALVDSIQTELLTVDWNRTERDYPNSFALHQLFEEQVVKTPKAIALIDSDIQLTYNELNRKANQLAHFLQAQCEIQPDDRIALCLSPSCYRFIGLLGTLKSGAAYVPINSEYPDQRIKDIMEDAGAKALVTDIKGKEKLQALYPQLNIPVIVLDEAGVKSVLGDQPTHNPVNQTRPSHLVYVMYTSGSTGRPKGVLVEHRNVVNYVSYVIRNSQLSEHSVGAHYVAFGFDVAVIDTYPVLLSGGKICIVPAEDRTDVIKVNHFFEQHRVTFGFLPTSFGELFLDLPNAYLKDLMLCGEKLNKFVPTTYRIINAYGPTETTVQSTGFDVTHTYENIPIGKPIDNLTCYVLDSNLKVLPIGCIGELFIGGEGVARGYLNLPEMTAQKFIANPFQTPAEKLQNRNERIYHTGDFVH